MSSSALASDFREVRIFAESMTSTLYQKQAAEFLAHWQGLRERDVEVHVTFGSPRFEIVLLGKDGGEKRRQNQFLAADELFRVIDTMPMRKAEREERQ